MELVKIALKESLESLLEQIPNKKLGICNNVYDVLKQKYELPVAISGLDLLKQTFVDLGYNLTYPVEYHFLKDENLAKIEFYEGGQKWDQKKSKYGKFRLLLVKEVIEYLEK